MRVLLGCVMSALLLVGLLASSAVASESLENRLAAVNASLLELERNPLSDEGQAEIARARLELNRAERHIADDERARASAILVRLEARERYLRSIVDRAAMEALADQRETEANDMLREANQAQLELESALRQRQRLQEDVNRIVESLEGQGGN